jgi:signal transduction histidine kinase
LINWQKLIVEKERLFWMLHTGGWLGFGLVYYLGSFLDERRGIWLFVILLNSYAGWILTIPLRYVYRRIWELKPLQTLIWVGLSSYLVSLMWAVIRNLNNWEIYRHGFRPDEWLMYFRGTLDSFVMIVCWSGLYFGVRYSSVLQKEKQNALRATTMAHQAHLKMLRYQLNPHFLFNTLNAISTLILMKDNKTADAMVSRLSDFLRYSLDNDPIKKVALRQEIQAIDLYLQIEKVRFDERLTVDWDVNEEVQNALVPSLILQPLIENSIKYAISKLEQGGHIIISAKHFGRDLLLEVTDNGPGAEVKHGQLKRQNGVGLPNIQERLNALYHNDYSFVVANNQPTGLKVSIRIPFEVTEDD